MVGVLIYSAVLPEHHTDCVMGKRGHRIAYNAIKRTCPNKCPHTRLNPLKNGLEWLMLTVCQASREMKPFDWLLASPYHSVMSSQSARNRFLGREKIRELCRWGNGFRILGNDATATASPPAVFPSPENRMGVVPEGVTLTR